MVVDRPVEGIHFVIRFDLLGHSNVPDIAYRISSQAQTGPVDIEKSQET